MYFEMNSDDIIELKEILFESFETESDYLKIQILDNLDIEQGLMGDIIPILLVNDRTKERKHIILKQQKTEDGKVLEYSINQFENEMHFYKSIWKKFSKICNDRTGKVLELVPHCHGMSISPKTGIRRIVLENVTTKGFNMLNRTTSYDDEHLKLLFRAFGNFHSFSMILKQQNEFEYRKLIEAIKPTYQTLFNKNQLFTKILKGLLRVAENFFDPNSEGHLIEKLVLFELQGPELCYRILSADKYEGVLLHCDCWNNNFMFKNNVSQI